MHSIHFYFEKDTDYVSMLNDFHKADDVGGSKVVAKMVLAPKPLAGIIFTEAFSRPLSVPETQAKELIPITTVTGRSVNKVDVVDVTVEDLLSPHSKVDGQAVCEAVDALTDQALTAMNVAMNGRSDTVFRKCQNKRVRVKLGEVAAEKADDIIHILNDDNTARRGSTSIGIAMRVNACLEKMGYVDNDTTATQKLATQKLCKGRAPSICCKGSAKKGEKTVTDMNQLYAITRNLTLTEQTANVSDANLIDEEKRQLIQSILNAHAKCEKVLVNMVVDLAMETFLATFAIMVRSNVENTLGQFMQLDEDGYMESQMLLKLSTRFTGVGFDVIKYIVHHPSTAMWITNTASVFKNKLCKEMSLRIFAAPEMSAVGQWATSTDPSAQGVQEAAFHYKLIKKAFLELSSKYIRGQSFQTFVQEAMDGLQRHLILCIATIPGGRLTAESIQETGAFTTSIGDTMKLALTKATEYAIMAFLIKEAHTDTVDVLLGTCINSK